MNTHPSAAVPLLSQLRDFDGSFDRAFTLVAFAINRHLIDHMLRTARNLTMDDYEAMIIWGVLAHQNIAHLLPPGSVPSAVLNDKGRLDLTDQGLRPLRLRDIVQITHIPRETVRRKLDLLASQQCIERTPRGWVCSRARTEPELRDFTRESVRRFLMAADEVMRTLRAVEATGPAANAPARAASLRPATSLPDAASRVPPALERPAARGQPDGPRL
jgi:hypothetical protein